MYEGITHLLPTLQDCVLKPIDANKLDEDGLPFAPMSIALFYNWFLNDLAYAVTQFEKAHLGFDPDGYEEYLGRAGIEVSAEAIRNADVSGLDGLTVLSLLEAIYGICKALHGNNMKSFTDSSVEYKFEDPMLDIFRTRSIERWLLRLKEIDDLYPTAQAEQAYERELLPRSYDIRR